MLDINNLKEIWFKIQKTQYGRYVLPLIAAGLLLFAISYVSVSQIKRPSHLPPTPPAKNEFRHAVAGNGIVESSSEEIAIGSHLSGVIEQILVKVGDHIDLGTPLFHLDDRQLNAERKVAKTQLEVAEADVELASQSLEDQRKQLSFFEKVQDKRAISADDLAKRQYAVKIAQSTLELKKAQAKQSQANLDKIDTELDRLVVRSPIKGKVLQVNIRAGEYAVAGVTSRNLMVVGNVEPLHVRVDVDEVEIHRLKAGLPAKAYLRGRPSATADLEFIRFDPLVIPKKALNGGANERVDTRVLQAIYAIKDPNFPAFVGQQVDVYINVEQ